MTKMKPEPLWQWLTRAFVWVIAIGFSIAFWAVVFTYLAHWIIGAIL